MTVAARDEVRVLAADRALDQAGPVRVAQAQHLRPSPGGTGTRACSGMSSRATSQPAATTTAPAAISSPPARTTPVTRSPSTRSPDTRAWRTTPRPPAAGRLSLAYARRSAATSLRGSTEWSESISSARRIVGASAGSSRRACDGRRRSTGSPRSAPELGQAIERLGLVAVAGDDHRAHRAVARVLQLADEGLVALARSRRPSASSSRSPNSASETGASMPAATCHALGGPTSRRRARPSSRRVARPARRRRDRSHRRRRPRRRSSLTLPLSWLASLRRHDPDQVRRSAPRWRPLSPIAGSRVLGSWYPLGRDPSRAPVHRPPLPRLPRHASGSGSRLPCAAGSI